MKKLSLNLEKLTVESFRTAEEAEERGTVAGHYGTTHTEFTYTNCLTCYPDEKTCDARCTTTDP
jgi:hypothetical protein